MQIINILIMTLSCWYVIVVTHLTVTCCRAVAMLHSLDVAGDTWQHNQNQRHSLCFCFRKPAYEMWQCDHDSVPSLHPRHKSRGCLCLWYGWRSKTPQTPAPAATLQHKYSVTEDTTTSHVNDSFLRLLACMKAWVHTHERELAAFITCLISRCSPQMSFEKMQGNLSSEN